MDKEAMDKLFLNEIFQATPHLLRFPIENKKVRTGGIEIT
jgi:hypothetical protein